MSRRKGKSTFPANDKSKSSNKYIGSEVFRNSSAVCDDTDPHQSLKYLVEIFSGKLDEDVISMVFSECAFSVDQSLETLMSLTSDVKDNMSTKDSIQHSEISQQESRQSLQEISKITRDTYGSKNEKNYGGFESNNSANNQFNSLSFLSTNQTPLPNRDYQSLISYPNTPSYAELFPPSNLLTHSISANTSKNWSKNPPFKFDPSVPGFKPKFLYNNSPNYGTPKKYMDVKSSPNKSGSPNNSPNKSQQLKRNKKESYVEDLKCEEGSSQIRIARDLIKNGRLVLIILRGLPGSGKSTLARNLKYSGIILSTDDYFAQNGEYFFDPRYLQEAHEWNKNRALKALSENISPVIIDNTNTEAWEMAPYVCMGRKHHYNIVILEPNTAWKFKPAQLVRRNQHGVSKEKIIRMLERYQHNITVESFAGSSNMSTSKNNNKSICNTFLPDSHNTSTVKEAEKNSKQSVSLKAVVHQEESSHDSLLEKEAKNLNDGTTTSDIENELPSCISIKCPKCTKKADALENMASATKSKTFDSLEELKSLVQDDSEDMLSLCRDCYLLKTAADERSSWEEVTEHDSDFRWKIPMQECSSSSSLNSLQLQSDVSSSVASDDTSTSKSSKSSSESELLQTSVFQKDTIKSGKEIDDLSLLSDTTNSKESELQIMDTSAKVIPLQSHKSSAVLEDSTEFKNNSLAHLENCYEDINLNALSSFAENHEKNKLFQNSISQRNVNNDILSKAEDVHVRKFAFESANRPKPSQRKPSRSFDESLVFRENKTKEVDKNVETNLLRSKFSSVPLFEHEIDDDHETNALDPSTKFAEKQNFLIKGFRSGQEKKLSLPDTQLWISDDVDEIIPWVNDQSQSLNSTLNTTKTNVLTWDKDCNFNLINSKSSDFVNPKPQRSSLKTSLSFENRFSENKDSLKCLSLNDYSMTDATSDWDDSIKKNNFDVVKESLFKPKPQRNFSENKSSNKTSKFSLEPKFEEKDMQANSLTSSSSSFKTPNKKFGQKKRSPLLKNAEKYMDCNWSLPQFLPNLPDTFIDSENIPISNCSAETQTEPSDFVQLYKMDTCGNMPNYPIITASINTFKSNEFKNSKDIDSHEAVSQIAKFEKGTSTEDLVVDTEVSEKMDTLRECFPDVSEDDLEHLLNLCHEDEAWMINLLLDSGYKYNNPNPEEAVPSSFLRNSLMLSKESMKAEEAEENSVIETEKEIKDEESFSRNTCSISETTNPTLESQTNEEVPQDYPDSSTFEKLHFTLDPAFAIQLEELFGPVIPADSSNPSERTVEIDLEFAKLIYDKWKDTVQSNASLTNTVGTPKKVKKNRNLLFGGLNKQENCSSLPRNFKEPSSFSEIMDMEYALQIHKNQKLKKDADFATKLKRIELYNRFPGADPIALDEIFESNNYSFKNSILALGEDLGEPSTTVKEKNLNKVENAGEYNKSKILQEFENNDWSDWICKENNVDGGNEVLLTIPPEAEELRKIAAEHYVLRQEFIQKAQNSGSRGMKDVAAFYSQKGREHGLKYKESNKAACNVILQHRNSSVSSQVLDVHGLFVQEAIPCVEEFLKAELQRKPQNGVTTVSIITGQGNHSVQGPKLRPSVMEFLKKAGYRFAEVNRGVLEVYLVSE